MQIYSNTGFPILHNNQGCLSVLMNKIWFSWLQSTYESTDLNLIHLMLHIFFCCAVSIPTILMIWKLIIILSNIQLLADFALFNISNGCSYLSQTNFQILLFQVTLFLWAKSNIRLKRCNIWFVKIKTSNTFIVWIVDVCWLMAHCTDHKSQLWIGANISCYRTSKHIR